ncbi:ABC transporter ATP-binding protein [Muricoccus aerilatus]|uniref:ABC transporter ATP-binding protein n=1 Tax=Muricoccus aerilatus TaxID=452982 RepID=UPI0005C1F8A1|nr:ABC transporter ATP-binding protein [Roseomonas aerilata]
MLELDGVTSGYGAVTILQGVSLSVGEGEVVALLGPNGAGKTTTLRTISALLRPRAGRIRFNGQEITRAEPDAVVRLGLAHCPEERKVWPRMTVAENLELGAYTVSDRTAIRDRMEEVFTSFPVLRERRTEYAGRLSGGQQQMLAVGRALMSAPKLLLLDEPSLGLSPLLMQQVAGIIRAVHARGVSVLLVEQNISLALHLASRAYVLSSGRVVADSPTRALRADKTMLQAYLGG